MRKIGLLVLVIALTTGRGMAQQEHQAVQYQYQPFENNLSKDFTYGDYDRNALNMTRYDKDPTAHALVLNEYGKAWIASNGNTTSLNFEYHVKVKIFDDKAFSKGMIELPFYIKDNGTYEEIKISSIQAITYYNDASGAMQESILDPDSIFTVKENKHWSKIKFNMPGVRKGCIIEYKYRLSSPFLEKFRTWEFQADIPKLYSEYEIHIPNVFGYNISLRGPLKLTKDSVGIEKNCYTSTNLNSDCGIEDYAIKDIPAFKEEAYMTSPKNFMSALYFQLTNGTWLNNNVNLNQATILTVGKEWSDVDKLLKFDENFGTQLNRKSVFKDRLPNIIDGKTDTLEKARAIYAYIQKTIAFNNIYNIYTEDAIKKALDKHTGNVADINLALVTALNAAGITANAVLTSTRDNGIVVKDYPALSEFNYVIAVTNIGGKTYLLDATDPLLSFGMLPYKVLNDMGRVMPLTEPSYWINIKTPQRKTSAYILNLTLTGNTLKGTITHNSLGYEAYEKRKEIKSFKTTEDYIKSLSSSGFKIIKTNISNLDSLGMPLIEVYDVDINLNNTGNQLSFNPFLLDKLKNNPFTEDKRNYPVDFGMPFANSYTLTLHLPDNYTIDNPPQPISTQLANNGGEIITNFDNSGNTITYTQQYHIDKPVFSTAEYPDLKELLDKVVVAENTPIVLKKN